MYQYFKNGLRSNRISDENENKSRLQILRTGLFPSRFRSLKVKTHYIHLASWFIIFIGVLLISLFVINHYGAIFLSFVKTLFAISGLVSFFAIFILLYLNFDSLRLFILNTDDEQYLEPSLPMNIYSDFDEYGNIESLKITNPTSTGNDTDTETRLWGYDYSTLKSSSFFSHTVLDGSSLHIQKPNYNDSSYSLGSIADIQRRLKEISEYRFAVPVQPKKVPYSFCSSSSVKKMNETVPDVFKYRSPPSNKTRYKKPLKIKRKSRERQLKTLRNGFLH